jgi:hypothetical protein
LNPKTSNVELDFSVDLDEAYNIVVKDQTEKCNYEKKVES